MSVASNTMPSSVIATARAGLYEKVRLSQSSAMSKLVSWYDPSVASFTTRTSKNSSAVPGSIVTPSRPSLVCEPASANRISPVLLP